MNRELIRRYIPPALRDVGNRVLGNAIQFRGPYPDWQTALAATIGYDAAAILKRVKGATEDALANPCVYEQDGSLLPSPPPPSHALTGLLVAATLDNGRMSVVDLGGGLASSWVRWQTTLQAIPGHCWHVVEQPHFADYGKHLFADVAPVKFHTSIETVRDQRPNAALLSSVLQYLPDPMGAIDAIASLGCRVVVIDRTPFSDDGGRYIVTQHVPAKMGKSSYPAWFLPRDETYSRLSEKYELLTEFETSDRPAKIHEIVARYLGSIWLRRT